MFDDKSRDLYLKVRILIAIVVFTFFTFFVTLFKLQIINNEKYDEKVNLMAVRETKLPALRGEILDRNEIPLATNKDSFEISIIPAEVGRNNIVKVLENLSYALDIDINKLTKKIPKKLYNSYQSIELINGVDLKTINSIAEHYDSFKGVYWQSKTVRKYNDVKSLFHVIGYVNEISQDELQVLYNKGYSQGSYIGKTGIEKKYDELLRGKEGRKLQAIDVKGRTVENSNLNDVPPTKGNNLVLTIDKKIQELSELALGNRLGEVIVLKPSTGEILAMVSYPYADANILYEINNASKWHSYVNDKDRPLLNRVISGTYPPASTYKAVMSTIIIDKNLFPETKTVSCIGKMRFGDRFFRCHKETGHGNMNLAYAVANSCNIYFYTMAAKYVDIDYIVEYSKYFGFGELTQIDLPEEKSGVLPSPEWKKKRFNTKWVGGDTVNLSIGQGFWTVTPLQICQAYSLIVNEGKIYKPHILKEVRDPVTNQIIEKIEPTVLIETSIQKETFKKVKKALRLVCTEGTARNVITLKGYKIAGKTGTSQISGFDDTYHSWFIGFGPYDAPIEDQIIVCVGTEPSEKKEWWTPFATNIIFNGIFKNLDFYQSVEDLNWKWVSGLKEVYYGREQ